jgi:hypothetical protein
MYYNNKLANSSNKPKTTWSITKTITSNKNNPNDILMMEIDGKITKHHQTIAEEFNNYYASVADNIDEMLPWKSHINQILLRLNSACYAIKFITPLVSEDTLKMIYYSYVHSIITYGIILGGNSSLNNVIFKIQKRIFGPSQNQEAGILVDICLNN